MTVGGDKLIWNHSKNGEYTVKTGYRLAQASVETTSHGDLCGFSSSLRHMWKLKIPSKIKIHIWRSIFNALPVRHNILIRGISGEISYPFCSLCPEDISSFKGGSFADLFCWMEDHGRTDEFQFFLLLCWSLWIDRNTMVFKGITKPASETIDWCHILLKSYHLTPHNILDHRINQPSMDSWQPPPDGVLKINVDASVQASFDHCGIGIVGRDMRGHVFFAEGMTIPGKFSPLYAELLAIKEGILWALKSGWTSWLIESDALAAVQALSTNNPFSVEASLLDEIRLLVFNSVSLPINFSPRRINAV